MGKYFTATNDLDNAQFDVLWDSVADNPNLPYSPVPTLDKSLKTNAKQIIKAIDEVYTTANKVTGDLTNFSSFYNSVLGDAKADPTLQTNIQKIDDNSLKAIFKMYLYMVGDADSPTLLPSELGGSINEAIINTNTKLDALDTNIKTFKSGEDIQAFKVVCLQDDNTIIIADANTIEHSNRVIGISTESNTQGIDTKVKMTGNIENPTWNFTNMGKPVFLGIGGDLITSPIDLTGFVLEIGRTTGTDSIEIDIEEPILLQ